MIANPSWAALEMHSDGVGRRIAFVHGRNQCLVFIAPLPNTRKKVNFSLRILCVWFAP